MFTCQLSLRLQVGQLQTTKIQPYRVLALSGLASVRSIDHEGLLIVIYIRYLVVSSPLVVRPTRPTSESSQNYKFDTKLNM